MSYQLFIGLDPKSKVGEEYFFYRSDVETELLGFISFGIGMDCPNMRWINAESANRLGSGLRHAVESGEAGAFYRNEINGYLTSNSEISSRVEAMVKITSEFADFLLQSGGCESVAFRLPKSISIQGVAASDQLFKGINPKSKVGEQYFFYRKDLRSQLHEFIADEIDVGLVPSQKLDDESSIQLGHRLLKTIDNGKATTYYRCDYRRHFVSLPEIDSHVETMIRLTKGFAQFLLESGGFEAAD